MKTRILAALLLAAAPAVPAARADDGGEVLLLVTGAPAGGLVVADIPAGVKIAGAAGEADSMLAASAEAGGKAVPAQVVPAIDPDDGPMLVVLKLPGGGHHRVRLKLTRRPGKAPTPAKLDVRACGATFTHDAAKMAAMPSRIVFAEGGKAFGGFAWNDRAYDPASGSFSLRYDAAGSIEVLSRGRVCTVVRTRGRYVKPNGDRPPSRPEATYDWLYFHNTPLVFVRSAARQASPFAWRELHFLELNYPDKSFPAWAGGEPPSSGAFAGGGKSFSFNDWALLRDGPAAVGMLRAGRMLFHDGRGGYGTYLHARSTRAWGGWRDVRRSACTWLWVAAADDPVAEVRKAARSLPTDAHVVATLPKLRAAIEAARAELSAIGDAAKRRDRACQVALAEKLEAAGEWRLASEFLAGRTPAGWCRLVAGDLAVTFQRTAGGITCRSILDLATGTELAAAAPAPLMTVTLRNVKTGKLLSVPADTGWSETAASAEGGKLTLTWAKPTGGAPSGARVRATAVADAKRSRLSWAMEVTNPHADWGVWRVAFPRVCLGEFARDVRLLVPQAAGVVNGDVWRKPVRFTGTYPSGWASMQFMAAYDAAGKTGLYVATHDGDACTKDMLAETNARQRRITLAFDHPAPNMGTARVGFSLAGKAVWQLLRGDWFDASMVYRDWVRREAKWWPKLTRDGRPDTPRWMRELCLWGMLSGVPAGAVKSGKRFAEVMQVPVGFHWYNWHTIPFDNDYPHYFPPKAGFADAVAALQAMPGRPAYVMPYINGRLWDTRDKGATDFEFGKLARAAATKDEAGKVRTEVYGSKEADGSKVVLAAMCPATKLWRDRVKGIVLRLMTECGTKAVYIDQIAAAKPRLCFDASHGHPVGGGGWWVEAYGRLLTDLRKQMPDGCMITTECNAEPYVKWFDGYLTWHWQYDGQVPAFPAVYGGAVQMFGRAYRGGPTKDRALRMKAGQQLVFGEQIGWISASVADEAANAAFLRQVARLRRRLVRYFYAGEMARPPKLAGRIPAVTADWQWHGTWPVTTDAVLTGAWQLPAEGKLVLLFVNVSDQPVTAPVRFDANAYGIEGEKMRVTRVTAEGREKTKVMRAKITREITFDAEKAWAWEIVAGGE